MLNRGVDQRDIFLEQGDYLRFIYSLGAFNDSSPANNTAYGNRNDFVSRYMGTREQIVDVHGWCLMRNHYHLLLSEREEGGITRFVRKLNIGYAKFFNDKYKRSGTLFQGRTKKILIERDQQFNYILHYIHLNPLDYLKGAEAWRIRSKSGVRNANAALEYLKKYRWSSYLDYVGEQNFPPLLTKDVFGNAFGDYEKAVARYLKTEETKASPATCE